MYIAGALPVGISGALAAPAGASVYLWALIVLGALITWPALRWRPAVGLCALGLVIGAMLGLDELRWRRQTPAAPVGAVTGTVSQITLRGEGAAVDLAPDQHPRWQIRIYLDLNEGADLPAPGARVRLTRPATAAAPVDNPWQLDAGEYLAGDRVAWTSRGPVQILSQGGRLSRWLLQTRRRARVTLDQIPGVGAQVLQGLLLGDRGAVPETARDHFQRAGLAHLMAVSGLHVGGLAMATLWAFVALGRRLGHSQPLRIAIPPALAAAGAMVILAQQPLSATRAGIMTGAALLGRFSGRAVDPLNLMGFAAVIITLGDPLAWRRPAFQLSFCAVAALLITPRRWTGPVGAIAVATVAALATAPAQAWHFGTATPIAPLANLLLIPPAAMVIVPLGALGLLLSPWTDLPLRLAAHGAGWLTEAAAILARWGGSPWIGAWSLWIFVGVIALIFAITHGRWLRIAWGLAAVACGGIWLAGRDHGAVIQCVAAGQGDALLIRSGDEAALIDGGPDLSARVLLDHLRRAGIRRLRWVALSHGHPDHFNGLAPLLERRELEIGAFYYNGRWPMGPEGWRMARALAARGLRPERPPSGPHPLGDLQAHFIALGGPARWSENDASLVIRLDGPGGSALLMGDAEAAAEATLVARGVGPVDVLKAGHHGSKTSSTEAFVAAVQPRHVVFTTGRHNRYGFPHPPVTRRYRAHGVQMWRTDRHGMVQIHLDAPLRVTAHHPDQAGD